MTHEPTDLHESSAAVPSPAARSDAAPRLLLYAMCLAIGGPLAAVGQELPWPGGWRGFWTVWLAAAGAAVGSFLNVVAYRLPRGESLWRPGSRCPACGHAIRARDNLPILGWLLLRGKCRDCAAAISPRYPLVELCTCLLWGALAWQMTGAVMSRGNAPGDLPSLPATSGAMPSPVAWIWFVVAATLMSGLLVGTLMVADSQRLPRVLHLAVLSVLIVAPWWAPQVRPPALAAIASPTGAARTGLDASVDAAAGGAVGLVLSAVVAWSSVRRGQPALFHQRDLGTLLWLGVGLGWQGVAVVTVAGLLGELGRRLVMPHGPALPWLAWVAGATMIWLWLGWQWLPEWLTLGQPRGSGALGLAAAATAGLSWCCGRPWSR